MCVFLVHFRHFSSIVCVLRVRHDGSLKGNWKRIGLEILHFDLALEGDKKDKGKEKRNL